MLDVMDAPAAAIDAALKELADILGPDGLTIDHAQRRFAETIKDSIDPNGILSPGKQGIWPRSYRA